MKRNVPPHERLHLFPALLVDARVTSQAAFIGRANQKRQLSNAAIAVEIVDACHHCMRS